MYKISAESEMVASNNHFFGRFGVKWPPVKDNVLPDSPAADSSANVLPDLIDGDSDDDFGDDDDVSPWGFILEMKTIK